MTISTVIILNMINRCCYSEIDSEEMMIYTQDYFDSGWDKFYGCIEL